GREPRAPPRVTGPGDADDGVRAGDDPAVLAADDPADRRARPAARVVPDDLRVRLRAHHPLAALGPEDAPVGMPERRKRLEVHLRGGAGVLAEDLLVRRVVRDRRAPPLAQWRKCRTPVRSIVAPAFSAAAMTSASRIEPPGWTNALTPAPRQTSTPSGNG